MKNFVKLFPLFILSAASLTGCSTKTLQSEDPKQYEAAYNLFINGSDFHYSLITFPGDKLDEEKNDVNSFFFKYEEGLFGDNYFMHLSVNFKNEDLYLDELYRLSTSKITFKNGEYKEVFVDEAYPQIVAVCVPDSSCYEYVIYDETHYRFDYIVNKYMTLEDNISSELYIKEDDIPKEEAARGYNIYYYYVTSDGITIGYTSDEDIK